MKLKYKNNFIGTTDSAIRLTKKVLRISEIIPPITPRKMKYFSDCPQLAGYLDQTDTGDFVHIYTDGYCNTQKIEMVENMFECPCGKWKRVLFSLNLAQGFKCRECLGLKYHSQYISKKDKESKDFYYYLKYLKTKSELRQKYYQGRPTSKYLQLIDYRNKMIENDPDSIDLFIDIEKSIKENRCVLKVV